MKLDDFRIQLVKYWSKPAKKKLLFFCFPDKWQEKQA